MTPKTADHEVIGAGRHIIERPRLIRLLDETTARIIMLVAPAGYGKTTLARQWLGAGNRTHAWYAGSSASADVAALAAGLADAVAAVLPAAGRGVRELLQASPSPEAMTQRVAELLAEDFQGWPPDAWLVIDDYHFAWESPASEQLIDSLGRNTKVRLLLTSRKRPSWASARRLLYGEIAEVSFTTLSMDPEEAARILADKNPDEVPELLARAEGWPAVLGLAALSTDRILPRGQVPSRLFAFFAEELYQAVPDELRSHLAALAILPRVTPDLAILLFGPRAHAILARGEEVGFLTQIREGHRELHPLLRNFLVERLVSDDPREAAAFVDRASALLVERQLWDDMFDLAERFKRPDLLEALLITASPQLLVEGRLPTLTKWLAAAANIASPAVDLVHAELARRQGDYVKSEVLALEAARLLPRDHALTARAFLCAGQSAHLLDREEAAAKHLARARALADDPLLKLEAIRGEFIVAVAREAPDAFDKFAQFERLCSPSPLDQVRLATARLSLAHHFAGAMGGIQNAIFYANRAEPLIPRLADPLIRTSFLNRYAYSLSLLGQYHEALVTIARLFTEADKYELPFVRPYAYVTKAAALLGLRRFSEAEESLNHARASERWGQGRFLAINCCVLDAKLKLAQDLPGAAQRIMRQDVRNASVPDVLGEYVGTKALVQAVAGRLDEALSLASEAANLTHHVEATVLAAATRAVVALRSSGSAQAIDAFAAAVRDSGNIDGLVISYRAYHPLALALSRTDFASDLDAVFERANDHGIAESVHDSLADSFANPKLTARETEVLRLLTGGLSNRQIAEALFLSEATVKVHIRRVFLKIRVRTRTQAAMKASLHGL